MGNQVFGPLRISVRPAAMDTSIQLHCQVVLGTVEIDDVCAGGMLPAKLHPAQPAVAQMRPQDLFGWSGRFAQF